MMKGIVVICKTLQNLLRTLSIKVLLDALAFSSFVHHHFSTLGCYVIFFLLGA